MRIEVVPIGLRPLARTTYFAARSLKAQLLATARVRGGGLVRDPIFIIGCGRSGTTLLGRLFGAHPMVRYLNEPFDFWAAVDPVTDLLQLYRRGTYSSLMDASSVTPKAQRRFQRLMAPRRGLTLVEKSPINALRIGYLDALAPDARFVHIVRDGLDVVRSIEKMATVRSKMAFRAPLNDWWGVNDAKWPALEQDGRAAGYYPDEVAGLATDRQRGAYEWLLSLHEVDAWRDRLGSRLIEFRYEDLTNDPVGTLKEAAASLALTCPDTWLELAGRQVRPARSWPGKPLALPEGMCGDFNLFQERFDFRGRAVSLRRSLREPLGQPFRCALA
jgi:Sulfotransferase family